MSKKKPVSIRVWSEIDRLCVADDSGLTFKYAQLESAIASLHNIPVDVLKTFRSRLKHFQRIGLVPSSPGKGQKIQYRIGDAIIWAMCFELSELGLPPDQIKDLVRLHGPTLYYSFEGPLPSEDQILWFEGNFLEWHLNPAAASLGEGKTSFGTLPASKLCDVVFKKGRVARALMINLTHLKQRLGEALGVEWR